MADTVCDPILCAIDEFVQTNTCVACAPGTANDAGDPATGADTVCDPVICLEDEFVQSNACVTCAPGTANPAGDDASGADTSCSAILCAADERVQSNTCVPCPAGERNLPGDDASGADTFCVVPIETLVDCTNTAVCQSLPGTGTNGGDVYLYTLLGDDHPFDDDAPDATCFGTFSASGNDLVIEVDVTGFDTINATTCNFNPDDSSLAIFDGDPAAGGMQLPAELACSEDDNSVTFCSDATATIPAGVTTVYISVDEWNVGDYWDNATDRGIDVDLYNAPPPVSGVDIIGCPANNCTIGTGPNNGTEYAYVIQPADHPTTNDAEASCFDFTAANDLLFEIDVTGFTAITANTCNTTLGGTDSSVAIFDADPSIGTPNELVCQEDTVGFPVYCAQVGPNAGGVPVPV
ncbi:MAG: hypothetical protein AAGK78_13125, partial [Planctomycetota bacterium]